MILGLHFMCQSITKPIKKTSVCLLPPGQHQWLLGVVLEIHKESIKKRSPKLRTLAFSTKANHKFAKGSTLTNRPVTFPVSSSHRTMPKLNTSDLESYGLCSITYTENGAHIKDLQILVPVPYYYH